MKRTGELISNCLQWTSNWHHKFIYVTAVSWLFSRIFSYFHCVVKNSCIIYVSTFFSLLLWNSKSLWIRCCPLPIHYNSFWYAVEFTKRHQFMINMVFCWHTFVGITDQNRLFLNRWCCLQICWWQLPVCDVVNLSTMSFTNMVKTDPKKVPSQNFILYIYISTMTRLFIRKKCSTLQSVYEAGLCF